MTKFQNFVKGSIFPWFGILGTLITSLGCVVSAAGYVGSSGQSYSMLNYFISELGAVKTSELAIAFNLGVFLGGSMLTVFMVGMIGYLTTKIGKFAGVLGTCAGVGGALVGIFPMDVNIAMHLVTAMTFFYGGLITTLIMTIGIFREKEPHYPLIVKVLGIVSCVFFFIFNISGQFPTIFSGSISELDPGNLSLDLVRPAGVWWMAVFEWLSLIGMLVWMFSMGVYLQKIARLIKK